MNRFVVVITIVVSLPVVVGCAQKSETARIRAVLDEQAAAWNKGDIDSFMAHYWRSEDLAFVSTEMKPDPQSGKPRESSRTSRGWQATRDRYMKRYPDRRAMGHLTFSHLQISCRCCPPTAKVAGRYHLKREDGPLSGRFVLDMREIDGAWVIVRDHTTADSDPLGTR